MIAAVVDRSDLGGRTIRVQQRPDAHRAGAGRDRRRMTHRAISTMTTHCSERVRRIAESFPDAAEKVSHGRPAFFTTRSSPTTAGRCAAVKVCGRSTGSQLSSKPTRPNSRRSKPIRGATRPPTSARPGWIRARPDRPMDWNEVRELLESSYRLTAGPKRVARLDAVKATGLIQVISGNRAKSLSALTMSSPCSMHRCQYRVVDQSGSAGRGE